MYSIQAVIFDMDGVLIDAKDWHYQAFNHAIGLFGYRISRFEHLSRYDGLPTREKLRMLSDEKQFPRSLHEFTHRMKQLYTLQIAQDLCHPHAIHVEALSQLRRQGYIVGLASNSIRRTVDVLMQKSQLAPLLHFTISNEDVTRPKPDPEIYQVAMRMANVEPHRTLVVEDNQHGIAAARAAGAHVLQVRSVADVTFHRLRSTIDDIERNQRDRAA